MYYQKTIIKFNNFIFKNGNEPKPKYFIVLHANDDDVILASLPTRSNHIPRGYEQNHGCIDIPEGCFNCFVFEKEREICEDTNFSFPLTTLIYSEQVDDYSKNHLTNTHPVSGIDYEICGTLKDDEFSQLIECFKISTTLRRRYRKTLS